MTLQPGQHVWWHYRRSTWKPGRPERIDPMIVVRDDSRALVAWLAPGTTILKSVLDTGDDVRSAPLAEMFLRERSMARSTWSGEGILRIAPIAAPWSVWLFWEPGWKFNGWYVNLETPIRREGDHVYTEDQVLDVCVAPDRTSYRKDEHELRAAVTQNRYTDEAASSITRNAAAAEAAVAAWQSPFCDGWENWRPDPTWTTPPLPHGAAWDFDLLESAASRP